MAYTVAVTAADHDDVTVAVTVAVPVTAADHDDVNALGLFYSFP